MKRFFSLLVILLLMSSFLFASFAVSFNCGTSLRVGGEKDSEDYSYNYLAIPVIISGEYWLNPYFAVRGDAGMMILTSIDRAYKDIAEPSIGSAIKGGVVLKMPINKKQNVSLEVNGLLDFASRKCYWGSGNFKRTKTYTNLLIDAGLGLRFEAKTKNVGLFLSGGMDVGFPLMTKTSDKTNNTTTTVDNENFEGVFLNPYLKLGLVF